MHFEGVGDRVIGEWKIGAPVVGGDWTGECGEQGLSVAIRNGQHGNFGDDGRIFQLQALGIFFRGYAGSKRVAGVDGIVSHAAALHTVAWTEAALGKSFARRIAVAFGIGIDDAADGAVFRGNLGLDAAPGVSVAGDGDRAFDGNTEAFEALVIFGDAVIDVDERRDDVAILRVGVVGWQLLGLLAGGRIDGESGLFEFRAEFHGAVGGGCALAIEKFKLAFFGRGEQDVVRFDLNVKAEFLEFCGKPVGVVLVVRRADVVRTGGEALHVRAHVLWTGNGAQLFFPLAFGARGFGGVAVER